MNERIQLKANVAVRWIAGLMIAAAVLFVTAWFGTATAEAARQPLDITVEPGFDQKVKDGKWFPVKVTITNPGDDLQGEIAIHISDDGNAGKAVVYAKQIDLPKMSTKTVWFTLPGKRLNANNNSVLFYENGIGSGKAVPLSNGTVAIDTTPVSVETLMVGVLARDPDTLNFLALLNQRGYQVQTVMLKAGDFPWESANLDGLDVLAFNDASVDAIQPNQVKEIAAWVEHGGRLVLAGGAGYAKLGTAFGALSPVTVNGTASVTALTEIVKATGRELQLNGTMTVSKAAVKSGETLYSESGIPLVVQSGLGHGSVTYIAYDLALQPLASWSGNPLLWERILSGALIPVSGNQKWAGPSRFQEMWMLNNALDHFAQLMPPAYGVLMLLFLVYALIVAPALYLILKKLDKREWAWFAIPAIAVLTSGIIYGVGASGRGSTLAQTLSIVELSGTGTANRIEASSVFVPSGGDYTLEWSGKRNVSPFMFNDGGARLTGDVHMIIRPEVDRTSVSFENVPFWSVRKAYSAGMAVEGAGKFDYSIKIDASALQGEVVNGTQQDLYEAGIVFGGQWIRIGDLQRGEKKPFSLPGGSVGGMNSDISGLVFPYRGSADDFERERALLQSYAQAFWNEQVSGPYMLGFAKSSGSVFTIDGADVSSDQVTLFVQKLALNYEQGNQVFIPGGLIVPTVESSTLTYINTIPGGVDVGSGDFTLAYRLPDRSEWVYNKVSMAFPGNSPFAVQLWNEAKQAYLPLNEGQVELTGDSLKESLASGSIIRLKVTNSRPGGVFRFPVLSAEGAVKR